MAHSESPAPVSVLVVAYNEEDRIEARIENLLALDYPRERLEIVVASDGSIWFTDPGYGILSDYEGYKGEFEQDGCYVFRLDPEPGELEVAVVSSGAITLATGVPVIIPFAAVAGYRSGLRRR